MQNSYRVQRGDTLATIAAKNGTSVKAIAEANGIKNVNKIREGMTISIPTNATIQPMGSAFEEGDGGFPVPGDQINPAAAVLGSPEMVSPRTGIVKFSDLARTDAPNSTMGWNPVAEGLERYGNVGGEMVGSMGDVRPSPRQQPARPLDSFGPPVPGMSRVSNVFNANPLRNLSRDLRQQITDAYESNRPTPSPSQGEFVSPSQDDRRPQTVGEAVQRFRYDRDNAKQGARDLPGRVMQAIIGGDMSNPDGFGNFPAMTGQRNPTEPRYPASGGAPIGLSSAQLMALLAQMQQQPGITSGQSQMDLINNTFV